MCGQKRCQADVALTRQVTSPPGEACSRCSRHCCPRASGIVRVTYWCHWLLLELWILLFETGNMILLVSIHLCLLCLFLRYTALSRQRGIITSNDCMGCPYSSKRFGYYFVFSWWFNSLVDHLINNSELCSCCCVQCMFLWGSCFPQWFFIDWFI